MEIKQIDTTRFIAKVPDSTISEINSIIMDLSLGDIEGFDAANNDMLFDKMLARRIASEMYKRDIKFPDTGFVVVDTNINNRNISFSIGNVYINGSYYRHSDVIYL